MAMRWSMQWSMQWKHISADIEIIWCSRTGTATWCLHLSLMRPNWGQNALQPMSARLFQRILKPMITIVVALCCIQSSVSWMRSLNGLVFLPVLTTWASIVVPFCLVCAKIQNKRFQLDWQILLSSIGSFVWALRNFFDDMLYWKGIKYPNLKFYFVILRTQYLEFNLF